MVRNGYVLFIPGGVQDGVILDYTCIIAKCIGRVQDGDPEHAIF